MSAETGSRQTDQPSRIILSHPGCGPFVQQAARAIYERDLLAAYVTTFCYRPHSRLGRMLKAGLRLFYRDPEQQLFRRRITEVPDQLVFSHPLPNFFQTGAAQLPLSRVLQDRIWERAELWFDRVVARKYRADAVYSYEFAALETFRAFRSRGGICIYDMPIAHHATQRKWVDAELRKFPELETSYLRHLETQATRRNARKDKELELADWVVTASKFVADSVASAGFPRQRIWIVPSGSPPVDTTRRRPEPDRCVFIAAGGLSVRKGIHYLLKAWRDLKAGPEAELWLVGEWQLPESWRQDLPGRVRIQPTVPRPELYQLFDRAHALILPTFAEGLALTPLQAMARGVAVITTPNSGVDAFIEHGTNGWLAAPGDAEGLATIMKWCVENRSKLPEIGMRAAETMSRWQWSDYRASLGRKIDEVMEAQPVRGRALASGAR